ncbi:MAG TPA: N-acetylneuraminate synthase family protein [Terracidiphilus sp.]|nr:N-acetylneuraminate synthase family protein [Terracidiphilus sp.]
MTSFIAEIGLNHIGEESRATELLTSVLDADVDSITFQVREPKFYQSEEITHRPLAIRFYKEAAQRCHEAGRQFGIAIADRLLVESFREIGTDFWKTLSWDFGNQELREALFKTGRPVFLSTGLSDMATVVEGSKGLRNATLIHTQLSQDPADVNLKAIPAMAGSTGLPVAFGLHCEDQDILKVALAFEPAAIFFYVKQSGVKGLFDDQHAIDIQHLKNLVAHLRSLQRALGTGQKESMRKPHWVV